MQIYSAGVRSQLDDFSDFQKIAGILDVVKFLENRWKNNWDLHFLIDLREAADISSCLMYFFNYFWKV